MPEVKRPSLVKPTQNTPYHIDFEWWGKVDRDWRVYLRNYLCPEHREAFANMDFDETVDWVDPETAEVQRVDGLQHVLIAHCAQEEAFFAERATLVDSVFRIFLANGNAPLTTAELAEKLGRQPDMILRTLSGMRVYRGLRPYLD